MKCNNCGATFEGVTCPYCGSSSSADIPSISESLREIRKIKNSPYSIVKEDGLCGVIDDSNNEIIPIKYRRIFERKGEVDFLKKFSIFCAIIYDEVYLFSSDGNILYQGVGKIEDSKNRQNTSKLIISHPEGRFSVFDMVNKSIILANIYQLNPLGSNFLYSAERSTINVCDKDYNHIKTIEKADKIRFYGHCIMALNNYRNIRFYDSTFSYIGALPPLIKEDEIAREVSKRYIQVRQFNNEIYKSVFGVYDIVANEWFIPREYLSIKYDGESNQFQVGTQLSDYLAQKQAEEHERELAAEERKAAQQKRKNIGVLLIFIAAILFVTSMANIDAKDFRCIWYMVGSCVAGIVGYIYGFNNND